MASPLIHPFGLPLLKEYKSLLAAEEVQNSGGGGCEDKKKSVPYDLASKLTDGLFKTKSWMESERTITTKILEVLQQNITDSTFTGEREEHVEGRNSQGELLKGNPDIVQRFPVVDEKNSSNTCGESTTTENENEVALCIQKMDKGIAMMITEASVDNNGGEQKLAQAYEYARLQKGGPSNQVLILIWLHFDRKFESGNGKLSERFVRLSITQESWLFVGDQKNVEKARVGFLWREVYETKKWDDVEETIRSAFMAYARSLACSRHLNELLVEAGGEWKKSEENDRCLELWQHEGQQVATSPKTWRVVSDNVAIDDDTTVYKIFDNRQHQTWRKVDVWLSKASWLAHFDAKEEFLFEESDNGFAILGYPINMNRKRINVDDVIPSNKTESMLLEVGTEDSPADNAAPQVVNSTGKRKSSNSGDASVMRKKKWCITDPIPRLAYPQGTVCVISYRYVNGTHVASKLNHFLNIAEQIEQMHNDGYIHGDIRNFNMLHPWPAEDIYDENYVQPKEGIEASTLIDFDFSCKETQKCRYPPGFAKTVIDNIYERCGRPGELLEKKHDWIEFASAISKYTVDLSDEFDSEDTTLKDYREHKRDLQKDFNAMKKLLRETGEIKDEQLVELLREFCEKWASVCLLQLNEDDKKNWDAITTGSNSPNKSKRAPKSTRTTVQSDGQPKAS